MQTIHLDRHADFEVWRQQARWLCASGVAPERVTFNPPDRPSEGLNFGDMVPPVVQEREIKAPKAFIELAERAACFSDPERFDRLYRLLWRLQTDRTLLARRTDNDVAWLMEADQAVRRDRHKMRAFVRFKKVGETSSGREQFMAWFEPSHFIVDLNAGFFQRRFPNMDWAILTPYRSVVWQEQTLSFGAGGSRSDVPDGDIVEDQWATYFQSIFNPARLKTKAMTAEMPRKYWHNLPEAALIPDMIRGARKRETSLTASNGTPPNPIMKKALYRRENVTVTAAPTTLSELNRALSACQRCPLWDGATQAVCGKGPDEAELMIVGEQPGDQEDIQGEPFIGPAGDVLNRALKEAGLKRQKIYVTNAVKHFKYQIRGKRRIHQSPAVAEMKACQDWLAHEMDMVDPRLIVALGRTAAHAVLGRSVKMADVRGQFLPGPDGRMVLVSFHPSYILRTQQHNQDEGAFCTLISDLGLAAERLSISKSLASA